MLVEFPPPGGVYYVLRLLLLISPSKSIHTTHFEAINAVQPLRMNNLARSDPAPVSPIVHYCCHKYLVRGEIHRCNN